MDKWVIVDKLAKMAEMVGISPDVVSKIKEHASASPSVSVAVVKTSATKPTEDKTAEKPTDKKSSECEECKDGETCIECITDEQIDKMTEQEAKDFIKKVRYDETSDGPTASVEKKPSSLQETFNKMGMM